MKIIGVTGGVGTGKSTVAGMLKELGAAVLDADAYAHDLMRAGSETTLAIARHFGEATLAPDGSVNRAALADKVFSDTDARRRLESLIHPLVLGAMQRQVALLREANRHPAVVLEIPLLYEVGAETICDFVIVVSAPPAIQMRRLRDKRNWPQCEIEKRLSAQWDLSAKVERADEVIDNGGSFERTAEQVKSLWHKHIKK